MRGGLWSEYRKPFGWTLEELANKASTYISALYNLARGTRDDEDLRIRISILLKTPVDLLFPNEVIYGPTIQEEIVDLPFWVDGVSCDKTHKQLEDRQEVERLLCFLNPREKMVIVLMFGLEGELCTLAQVARRLSVTRERVRQIGDKAIRKMSNALIPISEEERNEKLSKRERAAVKRIMEAEEKRRKKEERKLASLEMLRFKEEQRRKVEEQRRAFIIWNRTCGRAIRDARALLANSPKRKVVCNLIGIPLEEAVMLLSLTEAPEQKPRPFQLAYDLVAESGGLTERGKYIVGQLIRPEKLLQRKASRKYPGKGDINLDVEDREKLERCRKCKYYVEMTDGYQVIDACIHRDMPLRPKRWERGC